MVIRLATEDDLPSIDNIYNQAIITQRATADTASYNSKERLNWFINHSSDEFPIFVAETNGQVVAYMSFSAYRPRRHALRFAAEISYFVNNDFQQQGIGSALMEYGIKVAPDYNIKHLIAILLGHNDPSIGLLKKYGFKQWGLMPGIADFDGQERDHLYYGLRLL
jgi:phosphinothricin acetyltransferase